jgi:hypothetical protein
MRWLVVVAAGVALAAQTGCVPGVSLDQLEGGHVDSDVRIDDGGGEVDTLPDADGDADAAADADADADADVADDADGGEADADTCPDGWLDPDTALCWETTPGPVVSWIEALSYCLSMALDAGLSWRLPTVDELRTLIRGCPAADACLVYEVCPYRATCFDGCSVPLCTWLSGPGPGGCYALDGISECGWYWSSTAVPDRPGAYWGVDFDSASIYLLNEPCTTPATCVTRRICVRMLPAAGATR